MNCGRISGGGPLNVVPDFAAASYNLRVETADHARWVKNCFADLADEATTGDISVELLWTGERPPKERTPELDRLLADVSDAASAVGATIEAKTPVAAAMATTWLPLGFPTLTASASSVARSTRPMSSPLSTASRRGRALVPK